MAIRVQCDRCNRIYDVPDDKAGMIARCRCGNMIPVPSPGQAAQPSAPAPPPQPAPTPPRLMIEDEGDDLLSSTPIDAPSPLDDEGAGEIPGGITCPSCGMVSRPGPLCEWCDAALVTEAPPKPADVPVVPRATAPPPAAQATGRLPIQEVISEALQFAFTNAALTFGSTALTMICMAVPLVVFGAALGATAAASFTGGGGPSGGLFAGMLLAMFVVMLGLAPLMIGPLYVMDSLLARGRAEIGLVFRGYSFFWSIVGAALLMGLLSLVISLPSSYLTRSVAHSSRYAGIAVSLGFQALSIAVNICLIFTYMEIVDRQAGAIEALQASWETTAGHRLSIFLVLLPLGVVVVAFLYGLGLVLRGTGAGAGTMLVLLAVGLPVGLVFVTLYAALTVTMYRNLRGLEAASV